MATTHPNDDLQAADQMPVTRDESLVSVISWKGVAVGGLTALVISIALGLVTADTLETNLGARASSRAVDEPQIQGRPRGVDRAGVVIAPADSRPAHGAGDLSLVRAVPILRSCRAARSGCRGSWPARRAARSGRPSAEPEPP